MRYIVRGLLRSLAIVGLAVSFGASAQAPITLHGAVQLRRRPHVRPGARPLPGGHRQYARQVDQLRPPTERELGLEKDYFAYMTRASFGRLGIVCRRVSTFLEGGPTVEHAFLFRDLDPAGTRSRRRHAEAVAMR